MNKAIIYGFFLYEGFVSKRSPARNKRNRKHRMEVKLFSQIVDSLKTQDFLLSDKEILRTIYDFLLQNSDIKKYYPYTFGFIEKDILNKFQEYEGIPQKIWLNKYFFEIIEIMKTELHRVQIFMTKKMYFCYTKSVMRIFNKIHNYPRTLFPEIKPSSSLPFAGIRFDDLNIG